MHCYYDVVAEDSAVGICSEHPREQTREFFTDHRAQVNCGHVEAVESAFEADRHQVSSAYGQGHKANMPKEGTDYVSKNQIDPCIHL